MTTVRKTEVEYLGIPFSVQFIYTPPDEVEILRVDDRGINLLDCLDAACLAHITEAVLLAQTEDMERSKL